jgi:SAM-dependent methyltransferase
MIGALLWLNRKCKALAVRLNGGVHPKHCTNDPEQYWYMWFIHPEDHVLDLGCSHGAHTRRIAEKAGWTTGVDYDEEAIEAAYIKKKQWNISYVVADLEKGLSGLPIGNDRWDVVVALDILEHLHNRDQLLCDIHQVLKPDGLLLISVPNGCSWWRNLIAFTGNDNRHDPDHKREYSLVEIETELRMAGFKDFVQVPTVIDTPMVGIIDLIGCLSIPVYRSITRFRRWLGAKFLHHAAGFNLVCKNGK